MKLKNIIIGLYVGLIGLCCLSISMSLAWYVSSANLFVQTINVEIDADRDLKISTSSDLDTFKEKLQEGIDDITEVDNYKPVSSMLSSEWMNEKKSLPEFRDVASQMPVTSDGTPTYDVWDDGFYRQELYLLADDDLWVTIDPDKSFLKADEDANKEAAKDPEIIAKHPGKSEDEIVEELNKLQDCLRVSVLVPDEENYDYTIVDFHKNGVTEFGGLLDTNKDNYYDYYTSSNGQAYEIVYGELNDRNKIIYDTPENSDSIMVGEYNAFNAKHRKNINKFNLEKSLENGLEIAKENSLSPDDLRGINAKLRIPVKRNEPRKIVLSIYIEGWDLDCINDTMGATFNSNITFKIIREM